MNESGYDDLDIALLYDLLNERTASNAFYLGWVMDAGLMLEVARSHRADIEWTYGNLDSVQSDREVDLVIMSGHAFQVLITDEALRSALPVLRRQRPVRAASSLKPGTRHSGPGSDRFRKVEYGFPGSRPVDGDEFGDYCVRRPHPGPLSHRWERGEGPWVASGE